MDIARRLGRSIVAALPGPELDRDSESALRDLAPSGVILFARNLRSPAQTRELVLALREIAPLPLLISIDQEGGAVNRLSRLDERFLRLPPARLQADWGEERLEAVWEHVGRALAALGLDLDFAPVLDLDAGRGENAIGPRSFGTDPARVAAMGAACLRGLDRAGIEGCLKHFPGLGGTDKDTHEALSRSSLSAKELWEVHAEPYRRLRDQAAFVMTSHAHYPEVDGENPLPGTFSRRLVNEWLRERVGFEGLVISDDLEMGAVSRDLSEGQRAEAALLAGCDLALFCHGLDAPRRARDYLADRHETGAFGEAPLEASRARLAGLLARRGTKGSPPSGEEPFRIALASLDEELSRG